MRTRFTRWIILVLALTIVVMNVAERVYAPAAPSAARQSARMP